MGELLERILRWVDSAKALRERGEPLPEPMEAMLGTLQDEWTIQVAMREGISLDDAVLELKDDYVVRSLVRVIHGRER